MAPQFTTRNGLAARSDRSWSARAMRSLPVPLSPVMSTVLRPLEARRSRSRIWRIASELPSRSFVGWSRSTWARRRRFSATIWPFSKALATMARSSAVANGLVTKS